MVKLHVGGALSDLGKDDVHLLLGILGAEGLSLHLIYLFLFLLKLLRLAQELHHCVGGWIQNANGTASLRADDSNQAASG